MSATLHLPSAAPRTLTEAELTGLNLGRSLQPQNSTALGELLGTAIPGELLASEASYAIIGAENAADYDFAANESGSAEFVRLTGEELDESLVGPLLIIEA